MTHAVEPFDIDLALGRLQHRARRLFLGLAALALVGLGLWTIVVRDGLQLLDRPLEPVFTSVHVPGPMLYSGEPERTMTTAERALAMLGAAFFLAFALAVRRNDGYRRPLYIAAGIAVLGLVLLAQSVARPGSVTNKDLQKLADAGDYAELLHRVKARPNLPYGDYVGAQALVLSGRGAELHERYGAWLQKWSAKAAEAGYAVDTSPFAGNELWEGSWASARVMRALEIRAFGRTRTPFSVPYEATMRARERAAWQRLAWVAPPAGVVTLATLGLGLAWWRLRQNLHRAQALSLEFDNVPGAAEGVTSTARGPLPPIEFSPP